MAKNPRVSDFENYLNSSFGAYPYNSLDQETAAMGPGEQISPRYRSPLSALRPPAPAKPAAVPNPNLARAVAAAPKPPAPAAGPAGSSGLMPFQLVQSTSSNGAGPGLNFGAMGSAATPTAESAANEITNAPVGQANALLRQAQTPIAPAPVKPSSPLGGIGAPGRMQFSNGRMQLSNILNRGNRYNGTMTGSFGAKQFA